jgi:hypothetical protein
MNRPLKRGVINSIPLMQAVLCADCECISESRSDACAVCGGSSLVHLGRLLGSAAQAEAEASLRDPLIHRELQTLVDSAIPRRPQ